LNEPEKIVRRINLAIAFLLLLVAAPSLGQTQDPVLSLGRIYNSAEFFGQFFGPARWLSDGSGYTTLERSPTHARSRDIVRYDPATGARELLVPASRLMPDGAGAPLWINDYRWSDDGKKLLIFTNAQRVWRFNTRGDYWVLDLETDRLQRLGQGLEPASLMFAKFSPDATRAAYVYKHDLYVEDLGSGKIKQLTDDGTETLINGTSDWVYEEEFLLRDGFRWSPDGRRIAYWQFDSEGVNEFYLLNNTDSLYPTLTTIPYPKAGTTNSAVRVGTISVSGGNTRWFEIEGDPRNNYIPRMEWAGSEEVFIQHLNRLQNTNRALLGDAKSGEVRTVYTDTDEAWLDVVDDVHWLEDGEYFTWVSERDGWRHVYMISRSGEDVRLLPGSARETAGVTYI
jgi:dipeptidyl-peptidase-4